MGFKFTKANRILKRSEFKRLSRGSKKIHNRNFIALYTKCSQQRTRLGITVSKKVGGAVERNRIKRLAREFFRLNRDKIAGCWDIIIIAKQKSAGIESKQVFKSFEEIYSKISNS